MEQVIYALQHNGFTTIDYLVIIVYFAIMIGVGIKMGGSPKTAKEYFFAQPSDESNA